LTGGAAEFTIWGMQCKYRDPMSGKQCGNQFPIADPADPKYGYCFKHAEKMGLLTDTEQKSYREKREEGIQRKAAAKRMGKTTKQVKGEDAAKVRELREKEVERGIRDSDKLIHDILGDKDFDAAAVMEELREANMDFTYTDKNKKMLFVAWHISDPLTRKPVGLKGLCKVLGVTELKGREWMSDWFEIDLHIMFKKMLRLALPYVARVNLRKAITGDQNAMKEYFKWFAKESDKAGDDDWRDVIGEQMASEILAAGEEGKGVN
jgi:hypothetical protein